MSNTVCLSSWDTERTIGDYDKQAETDMSQANAIEFDSIELPPETETIRAQVREFLAREIEAGTFVPGTKGQGGGHSAEISLKCGEAGFIGMTWSKAYGGHERSFLDRFVVTEEMLAAGAPCRIHLSRGVGVAPRGRAWAPGPPVPPDAPPSP